MLTKFKTNFIDAKPGENSNSIMTLTLTFGQSILTFIALFSNQNQALTNYCGNV